MSSKKRSPSIEFWIWLAVIGILAFLAMVAMSPPFARDEGRNDAYVSLRRAAHIGLTPT